MYGFVSQQFLAFGAEDKKTYHLVVDVETDSIDSKNSIENRGIAQVLVGPDVPNFSVPDEPELSLGERLLCFVGLADRDDLVSVKRERIQSRWNGRYTPAGVVGGDVTELVEWTVEPVLCTIEKHQRLIGSELSIDIDVTMEYLEDEIPSSDIESELDDLGRSISNSVSDL